MDNQLPDTCDVCGSIEGNCEHEPCPACEVYRKALSAIVGASTLKKAWIIAADALAEVAE